MWITEEGVPVQDVIVDMLRDDDMSLVVQAYEDGAYTPAPGMSWTASQFANPSTDGAEPDLEEARDVMLQTAAEELAAWLDDRPDDKIRLRLTASPGKRIAKDLKSRGTVNLKRVGANNVVGGGNSTAAELSQVGQAMVLRQLAGVNTELLDRALRAMEHGERANRAALDIVIATGNSQIGMIQGVTGLLNQVVTTLKDHGAPTGDLDPVLEMMKIQAEKDRTMIAEVGKALNPLVAGVANRWLSAPVPEEEEEDVP